MVLLTRHSRGASSGPPISDMVVCVLRSVASKLLHASPTNHDPPPPLRRQDKMATPGVPGPSTGPTPSMINLTSASMVSEHVPLNLRLVESLRRANSSQPKYLRTLLSQLLLQYQAQFRLEDRMLGHVTLQAFLSTIEETSW